MPTFQCLAKSLQVSEKKIIAKQSPFLFFSDCYCEARDRGAQAEKKAEGDIHHLL